MARRHTKHGIVRILRRREDCAELLELMDAALEAYITRKFKAGYSMERVLESLPSPPTLFTVQSAIRAALRRQQ